MNRHSSRSHAMFMIELETMMEEDGVVRRRRAHLNLVDLAGSERQNDSKSTGDRFKVYKLVSILLAKGRYFAGGINDQQFVACARPCHSGQSGIEYSICALSRFTAYNAAEELIGWKCSHNRHRQRTFRKKVCCECWV